VFDMSLFEAFLKRIDHLKVPLIVGLWPLVSLRNAEFLNNEVPGSHVPDEVMDRLRAAKSKEEGLAIGTKIAKEMLAMVRPHCQGVQTSVPFGKVDMVLEVLEQVL